MRRTGYLIAGDENDKSDMRIGIEITKLCSFFKYLGATNPSTGRSAEDIRNKTGRERNAIRQLNSLF